MAAIIRPDVVLTNLFNRLGHPHAHALRLAELAIAELCSAGWGFEHQSEPGRVRYFSLEEPSATPTASGDRS